MDGDSTRGGISRTHNPSYARIRVELVLKNRGDYETHHHDDFQLQPLRY